VTPSQADRIQGVLIGTAVGDALGLPAEGLSPRRIARRWHGRWRMNLLFGKSMLSDDTEHTLMVAQSLLAAPADADEFQKRLARKLRWWFIALPAGIGKATAKACLKLWLGVPPARSGIDSAGNGPAMRSAIIGVFFADDAGRRQAFTATSTRLTHRDPRAEIAALAVAETAALLHHGQAEEVPRVLPTLDENAEWQNMCRHLAAALAASHGVREFAVALGLEKGVSGYAFHTVPVAIYAALRHGEDFEAALIGALECGGDTDTVGAIVGALVGARTGVGNIPQPWINNIADWPRSIGLLQKVAEQLSRPRGEGKPVTYCWPGVLPRNLFFLAVVLAHGLRRLLPPY
jgi:ADP-ribosylglycohydrolase